MAAQSPIPKKFETPTPIELVSKSTEKNVLEKYIDNSNKYQVSSSSLPYMDASTIDLQLLMNSEQELHKFGSLLGAWGCFQIVNHGIPSATIDQIRQLCKEFFNLPIEEKKKYAKPPGGFEGWGCDEMSEGHKFNWNDRMVLRIAPLDQRSPMFWPNDSLPKFTEIVEEYTTAMSKVREVLLKAISKIFKLEEDNLLLKRQEEGIMILRLNYYPPCPYPEQIAGIKAHSDVHLFTILLQDEDVEGLQVEKDGQWFKVPIIHDTLVVNVADMLEILSNGKIKGVYHRAVVNDSKERRSIAFAFGPPRDTEIGPLKEFITEETPQRYQHVKDYLSIAANNYENGERAIINIKLF